MVDENKSLKQYNTFGIEATARYFTTFNSLNTLQELLGTSPYKNLNLIILGGGSNLLLTKDVDGLVIKNELNGIEVIKEYEEAVYIKAGSGENWHQFVLYCLQNEFAGVENLSLIPGSVGASPMQNIGAYGVEIKDVFYELEAFHIHDKTMHTFSLNDCEFGYRESVFKKKLKGQYIICSVTYLLNKKPHFTTSYGALQQELDKMRVNELSINVISQAVINIRSSKLPDWKVLGNAGSFFKNPQISISFFQELKNSYPQIPS
ncbi:MAG TPA: UDP-N-acetylmuramate dehydrogenase, partial [Chitinophagaceae bacterium]|nr:UDP-N-acetylmuramate dehydrogenase [Chitinophagaceae bacterium]